MYISDQGLRAIQEERMNRLLARAELHRMLAQGRESASRGERSRRSLKSLLHAALGGLLYGHGKPSYETPSPAE